MTQKLMSPCMSVQVPVQAVGFVVVAMRLVWEADLVSSGLEPGLLPLALFSSLFQSAPVQSSCSNTGGTCSFPSSPFPRPPLECRPCPCCPSCRACQHLRTPDMASERWPWFSKSLCRASTDAAKSRYCDYSAPA